MDKILDNMFVFYDPNPDCPADEKYKAVGNMHYETAAECGLRCFISSDGYHFERANLITKMGRLIRSTPQAGIMADMLVISEIFITPQFPATRTEHMTIVK